MWNIDALRRNFYGIYRSNKPTRNIYEHARKKFLKRLAIRDGGFDYTTCLLLTASLQTQASITSPDFLRFVGKAMTNIWLRNTEVKGTGREINEATKLSRVISQSETPFRDVDIERFRSLKRQMTKPERRFKLRPDTTSTRSPYD